MEWEATDARVAMLRGWLEISGPITAAELAKQTSLTEPQVAACLEALEGEGIVLRGHFRSRELKADAAVTPDHLAPHNSQLTTPSEYCHRRLLARIHRLTIDGLRKAVEPVDVATYWRYLVKRHGNSSRRLRRR